MACVCWSGWQCLLRPTLRDPTVNPAVRETRLGAERESQIEPTLGCAPTSKSQRMTCTSRRAQWLGREQTSEPAPARLAQTSCPANKSSKPLPHHARKRAPSKRTNHARETARSCARRPGRSTAGSPRSAAGRPRSVAPSRPDHAAGGDNQDADHGEDGHRPSGYRSRLLYLKHDDCVAERNGCEKQRGRIAQTIGGHARSPFG